MYHVLRKYGGFREFALISDGESTEDTDCPSENCFQNAQNSI